MILTFVDTICFLAQCVRSWYFKYRLRECPEGHEVRHCALMDSKMEDDVDGGGVGVVRGYVSTPQKQVT